MSPEEKARLGEAAAAVVFQASQEGRLITEGAVLEALATGGHFHQKMELAKDQAENQAENRANAANTGQTSVKEEAAAVLAVLLAEHPALSSFEGRAGQTVYHAPHLLSRTYALIMDRKGSPLLLMVEEIRSNSRDYPRPVPVELFEAPPFELTPEEIDQALQTMATDPAFQDITFTPTSSGTVYLFSTLHLERGYAEFLAQRAESLTLNP